MRKPSGALLLSDLIALVQLKNRDLPPKAVDAAVRRVLDAITDGLANGDRVELRGFGVFEVREHEGRIGRNPKTGAPVKVEAKRAVGWRTGRALAKAFNDSTD